MSEVKVARIVSRTEISNAFLEVPDNKYIVDLALKYVSDFVATNKQSTATITNRDTAERVVATIKNVHGFDARLEASTRTGPAKITVWQYKPK